MFVLGCSNFSEVLGFLFSDQLFRITDRYELTLLKEKNINL